MATRGQYIEIATRYADRAVVEGNPYTRLRLEKLAASYRALAESVRTLQQSSEILAKLQSKPKRPGG